MNTLSYKSRVESGTPAFVSCQTGTRPISSSAKAAAARITSGEAALWMTAPYTVSAALRGVTGVLCWLCAAVTLSEKILNEGDAAVRDYRKFLSAGSSVPPIEALKLAGIDMSSPEPIRRALEVFRETVRKMEQALG